MALLVDKWMNGDGWKHGGRAGWGHGSTSVTF